MKTKIFGFIVLLGTFFAGCRAATYTVGPDGGDDFATITAAIAGAGDGDILIIQDNYDVDEAATITVDKELTIQGESSSAIIKANDATGPNTLFSVTSSNVTFKNLTLQHERQDNNTILANVTTGLDNIVFDTVTIETGETGIFFNRNNFTVKNCAFKYLEAGTGTDGNSADFIKLDGCESVCEISNNTFQGVDFGGNSGTRFVVVDGGQTEPFLGSLTIKNNTQVNGTHTGIVNVGFMPIFVEWNSLGGAPQGFELFIDGNTYKTSNVGIVFNVGTTDKAFDIFKTVSVTNNTDNTNHGINENVTKGLIHLDAGTGNDLATDPSKIFIVYGNTQAISLPLDADVKSAAGDSLIAYEELNDFTVALPPFNLGFKVLTISFPNQTDVVHHFNWETADSGLSEYKVFTGGNLVTTAAVLQASLHNQNVMSVNKLEISSVDANGNESRKIELPA